MQETTTIIVHPLFPHPEAIDEMQDDSVPCVYSCGLLARIQVFPKVLAALSGCLEIYTCNHVKEFSELNISSNESSDCSLKNCFATEIVEASLKPMWGCRGDPSKSLFNNATAERGETHQHD
ncbi:hypothetical protein AKJ16_DCAP23748 [Drosera capensis]